jgi:hypothetical protein
MLFKRDPLNCSSHFSASDTINSFSLRAEDPHLNTGLISSTLREYMCSRASKYGSELRMAENRAQSPLQILPRGTQVHRNNRDTSFHTKKSYC